MSNRGGRGFLRRGASNAATPPLSKSVLPQQQPQTQANPVAAVSQSQAAPAVTSMPQPPAVAPVSQTEPMNVKASDSDIPMPDVAMKSEDPEKPSWMKKRTKEEEKDNRPVKRRRKNASIVRSCVPRTSIQVLNEIAVHLGVPLPAYENIRGDFDGTGIYVDVVFQDVTHTGFGTDRPKAKQAGCEQHIRDIIRANMDKLDRGKKTDESTETSDSESQSKKPRIEEDSTPWSSIYSFVMKKYLELMEMGDNVLSSPPKGVMDEDADYSMDPRMPYQAASRMPYQAPRMPYQAPTSLLQNNGGGFSDFTKDNFGPRFSSVAPNVGVNAPVQPKPQPVLQGARPLPAKALPNNAVSMNPVMVLNQMRPDAVYSAHSDCGVAGENRFKIVVRLDGESYEGSGSKAKEAKKAAAKRAVLAVYGIECLGN